MSILMTLTLWNIRWYKTITGVPQRHCTSVLFSVIQRVFIYLSSE